MKIAVFVTFEGTDGVGKTTHIRLLKDWLVKKRNRVVLTREPGGGAVSEKIRRLVLNPRLKMNPLAELFLYQAARADHVDRVIKPALKQGKIVLCDRFTDATLAYQGFGRGISRTHIEALSRIATQGLAPDLTVLLCLPPSLGLKKARARTSHGKGDRLENEGPVFQKKVRKGYDWLARQHPSRIKVVNVKSTIQATQKRIRDIVQKRFKI